MAITISSLGELCSMGYQDFVLVDSDDETVRKARSKYPALDIWRRDFEKEEKIYAFKMDWAYVFPNDSNKYADYLSEPNAYILEAQGVS